MSLILYTERCILLPLSQEHIPALLPLFTSTEVRQYLGGAISSEAAEEKLRLWMSQEHSRYWTVFLKKGICIGLADLSPYHDPTKTELSYQFHPTYWGQGYAYETLSAILKWCRGRYSSVVS